MGWTRSEQYDWRLGKVRNIKRKEPKICPDPFSRLSINFDGSASNVVLIGLMVQLLVI